MMLERFQRKHTIIPGEKPSSTWLETNHSSFPEYLIEVWQEFGFFKTEDSFLFFGNPDNFAFLRDLNFISRSAQPFGRTSFGDFFVWEDSKWKHLMVNDGALLERSTDIEGLFEGTLFRDEFLDDVLYQQFHKNATKKLGSPESDECFAFVPAFALGGSARTSEIEKVKLREHLLFLSQLTGKPQVSELNVSSETINNLIDAYDHENP